MLGAFVGTLPDLDVVIDYGDAVANVTQHRGFSHSLLVLAGLGTLLTLVSARFAPARDIPLRHWLLFFLLILLTHPLMDALTTYGTQLFWPMTSPPIAWPIVFIIDPLYSLPLLVALVWALVDRKVVYRCGWALGLSSLYLLYAIGAKVSVEQRMAPVLAAQGLESAPRLVQPAPFTTLLWRVNVMDGDRHYESLVSLFDQTPPQLEALTRQPPLAEDFQQDARIQRLKWFTGDFLRYDSRSTNDQETLQVTDVRLGFPGFYPFTYQLATRPADDRPWQAVDVSFQVSSERGLSGDTFKRLGLRALGNPQALCATAFVEARWKLTSPGC